MEKTSLVRVSPDTSQGSFRFTAWQSDLQVVVAPSWETWSSSEIREQQWAIKSACGCWPWRILPSLPIVSTKVRSIRLLIDGFLIIIVLDRERRESAQEGEGLRHRGNGRASGAGVPEQNRRWVKNWIFSGPVLFSRLVFKAEPLKRVQTDFHPREPHGKVGWMLPFSRGSNQK